MRKALVDAEQFRALVRREAKRLRAIPSCDPGIDRVSTGRESGLHLALSFLKECVVNGVDPGTDQGRA